MTPVPLNAHHPTGEMTCAHSEVTQTSSLQFLQTAGGAHSAHAALECNGGMHVCRCLWFVFAFFFPAGKSGVVLSLLQSSWREV